MANLSFKQAADLITILARQATGQDDIQPITTEADFVSVATRTLEAGYNETVVGLVEQIFNVIVSIRPYYRKFDGLRLTSDEWGAYVEKINFLDMPPIETEAYVLEDGDGKDPFTVRLPKVITTFFSGSNVWGDLHSISQQALATAFTSSAKFSAFVTGLTTHFNNQYEQWLESMGRATLATFIAGKVERARQDAEAEMEGSGSVIHLLSEYNELTGLELTATTVRQPENWKAFNEWVYSRIADLTEMMTERSELFQDHIEGAPIMRHTPLEYQKVYMLSEYLNAIRAQVLADTYHESFLTYSDVEPINYWQSIKNPSEIQTQPTYMDASGQLRKAAEPVELSNVIGVIFDRDAININVYDESVNSIFNPANLVWNVWSHARYQYAVDYTEKSLILMLD